jgi:hypothetical protein
MTAEDLARLGYTRALWLLGEPKYYLRPDGDSIVTEAEALAEIGADAEAPE